jgi:NTP pyrophosphatase (non-canonical NTP hydrolase)|tara:strand:+ start:3206 stop:3634 length:429 start_codon:yes stop_codon:yes gene_type:complete
MITVPAEERKVDFTKYASFVNEVTSYPSQKNSEFIRRINDLDEQGIPLARLLTAAIGISAEGGEFTEIVKKVAFQGKDLSADAKLHMIKELGDVMWYITQACIALDVSLDHILAQNMVKLLSRYPEGTFDVYYSENRKEGDI